jgi:tetratricopeptide (TPR) repeat protein
MLKSQYLLVATALALITLLFLLPKVVVDNEGELQTAAASDAGVSSDLPSTDNEAAESMGHAGEIPDTVQHLINELREHVLSLEETETAKLPLDSLMALYRNANRFDSAANVAATLADNFSQEPYFNMAGNAYYEAFTYAVEEARIKQLGDRTRFYLQKSLELNPAQPDERVKIAMTYVASPSPMQGILMIRDVLKEHPENQLALFSLGVLSMQSGQYDKAIERFETLRELDPENTQVWFYLGLSYKERGDVSNAITAFEQVKQLESDQNIINTVDAYLKELRP